MLALTGVLAWIVRGDRPRAWIGASGSVLGCALGLAASIPPLSGPAPSLVASWRLPLATFSVGIDPLSAFFLIPTFALSALAAIAGLGDARRSRRAWERSEPSREGPTWLWLNLLTASMATVVVARNAVLFLVAWEAMSIASFFLVTAHDDRAEARRAGRIYLISSHVGTALLMVLFLLLGGAGPLDFDRFVVGPSGAGALFLLAVVGFGIKAGFVPFHVWLPEAHPAAPSHVSALMSGAMIKLGIYGLMRTVTFLGSPPPWWGWLLLGIGLVSGILGVLYALAQHELKRLLAYHSVENIGIIAIGLGLGLLGRSLGSTFLVVLGFGGALLHVWNHAIFKGLLFLGAGAVLHGAGTGEIERLGGLWKRMPWTGWTFLVGAMAISGLPPLNGFVSEFLIYLGAVRAAATLSTEWALAGVAATAGLGLIGGLAAACFAKAFGITFLGIERSDHPREAHDPGRLGRFPMALLAAACVAMGLAGPWLLRPLLGVLPSATGLSPDMAALELGGASEALGWVGLVGATVLGLLASILGVRAILLGGRDVRMAGTWDCGYAAPTSRMQYTASSFAQPILELFAPMLGTRVSSLKPLGPFPQKASLATSTPDTFRERMFRPVFAEIERRLSPFRKIQEGRVQVYVLYIALTLLALLVYQFLLNP